jgi:hypothetical protein
MVRRLAVFLGALASVAFATVSPNAANLKISAAALPVTFPRVAVALTIDNSLPCPVRTGSVIGGCPRPLIAAVSRNPQLHLCRSLEFIPFVSRRRSEPSVCGTGFRPNDVVDVAVHGVSGSTMWRVVADEKGAFHSLLPWPLCGLTPGKVTAVDQHDDQSNPVSLSTHGCP